PRHEPGAAVQARVVVGPDRPVRLPDDDDRLPPDLVLDVVAGVGDLLLEAGDLPDPRPQLLHLELQEVAREVARPRDQVGAELVVGQQAGGRVVALVERRHPTSISLHTPYISNIRTLTQAARSAISASL